MANPTTNYGFVLPTSTDLVTDLPADFDVALQGVDTRLKALNPATTLGDLTYASATANTNTRLGIGSSGQVLSVSGGVPAWTTPVSGSTFAGVSLWKSANQSFTSGAGVNTTFDTELFDTDGYHSTSSNTDRITIPTGKAGYYFIFGRATWNYSSTGQRIGSIRKNAGATTLATETQINMTSNFWTCLTVQIVANLAVGDYVTFENYQDGTGSLDLLGGVQQWTTFTAYYLGA
jgi:hypothetical protein